MAAHASLSGLQCAESNVGTGKRSGSIRLVSLATVLALCLSLFSVFVAPSTAGAQADELTQRQFDRLINGATADDPVYGPEEGELELDPDSVSLARADVQLEDLVATATFQNPYAGSRGQFDYGIQFRSASTGKSPQYLRFLVLSDGTWGITDSDQNVIVNGVYDGLDDSRRGENTLTVYAEGGLVHVAINGDYVGSAEVDIDGEGRVAVGTGFFGDSYQDGAATGYTDFTVWEIGGSGKSGTTKSTTRTGSKPSDKGKDDTGSKDTGSKKLKGTTYESPSYGYTLTYDDTWTELSSESANNFDKLVLSHTLSTLTVYGVPSAQTPEECRDTLIQLLAKNLEEAGYKADMTNEEDGEIARGSRAGSSYMLVMTKADLDDGTSAATLSYIECGPVNGNSDYLVGIINTSPLTMYEDEIAAREAVMDTLTEAGAAPDEDVPSNTTDEPTTKDDKLKTNNTSGPHISKGEEGRLVYVSPTYGFTVEVLPGWTVEEDSVQNGYDTLVVASDTARVTVSGFASSGTAVRCIDSIITNLQNDPGLTNVGIGVQPDGSDSRWDTDGQSEMVVFFTAGGVNYARYYACFEGNDGQSMLVFAYEALEKDIKSEFENIQTMLDLIRVP
jgi:hypothetical protein